MSNDIWFTGRDFNTGTPKYDIKMPTTQQQLSIEMHDDIFNKSERVWMTVHASPSDRRKVFRCARWGVRIVLARYLVRISDRLPAIMTGIFRRYLRCLYNNVAIVPSNRSRPSQSKHFSTRHSWSSSRLIRHNLSVGTVLLHNLTRNYTHMHYIFLNFCRVWIVPGRILTGGCPKALL